MFYDEMKSVADDLITEFGQDFVLKDAQAQVKAKMTGIFVEHSNKQAANQSPAGGTFLSQVQSQKRMLVKTSRTKPQIGMLVTTDSQSFRIIEVNQVKPASTVIYYELLVTQ